MSNFDPWQHHILTSCLPNAAYAGVKISLFWFQNSDRRPVFLSAGSLDFKRGDGTEFELQKNPRQNKTAFAYVSTYRKVSE